MIDYKALEYCVSCFWDAIDDAKKSIKKELESFLDSIEDEKYREILKICCARMETEINNAVFCSSVFDEALCYIRKGEE